MHDNISTALITAFEQHYDTRWDDAQLRNERLAWRAAWDAAWAAPAAVAGSSEFPHEQMDAMALDRYKVVPSNASMLWSHAVVAGDGTQQLYVGREVECQNMARKFAGTFLDGAFAFHSTAAARNAPAAPALEAPAAPALTIGPKLARIMGYREHYRTWGRQLSDATELVESHPSHWRIVAEAMDELADAQAAAPQAPAAPLVDDRAAYIEFLTGRFPRTYGKEEAGRWWDQGHVSALTWQAARAVAAAPAAPAVDAPAKVLSQAARDVLAERRRQVEAEGWTPEHDDQHDEGEMCFAAAGYAAVASDNLQAISRDIDRDLTLDDNVYPPTNYPWPRSWEFKPCTPRRALVKSGALILAEIERIDRCSPDAAQAAAKGEHGHG